MEVKKLHVAVEYEDGSKLSMDFRHAPSSIASDIIEAVRDYRKTCGIDPSDALGPEVLPNDGPVLAVAPDAPASVPSDDPEERARDMLRRGAQAFIDNLSKEPVSLSSSPIVLRIAIEAFAKGNMQEWDGFSPPHRGYCRRVSATIWNSLRHTMGYPEDVENAARITFDTHTVSGGWDTASRDVKDHFRALVRRAWRVILDVRARGNSDE